MRQDFSRRMLSHKWTKTERSVAVGNVIYLVEAENVDPTYRMGIVEDIKTGEDGCVQTVSIRYTNPGKWSSPKVTSRPSQRWRVLVQNWTLIM